MIIAPWATDIEFEHVNNYSDRMNYAWEVDRILDTIHDLGLYMHLNMQFHYTLEVPAFYDMFYWDWVTNSLDYIDPGHTVMHPDHYVKPDPGYGYQAELGLTDPIEFFTDSIAINHYKNKVRYMISRWGYSTNIGAWELYSEVDNSGVICPKAIVTDTANIHGTGLKFAEGGPSYKPYWHDLDAVEKIETWQIGMAQYIKQDLEHDQHLVCANYTGGPSGTERPNTRWGADAEYDQTYESEYIDMMTFNMHKGLYITRFRDLADNEVPARYDENEKPLFLSENGASGGNFETHSCDNGAEFIRSLWCKAFSGTAGPGFDYVSNSHDNHNVWHNYGILSEFLEGNTFATENWTPQYDLMGDSDPGGGSDHEDAELFALVNEGQDAAMGVLVNRRFNFYTKSTEGSPCHNLSLIPFDYAVPANISETFLHPVRLTGMDAGDYLVTYYNALTGDMTGISYSDASAITHVLNLENWQLCMFECDYDDDEIYDDPQPLVAFKAIKVESRNAAITMVDSVVTANSQNAISFAVHPNPAGEDINVTSPMVMQGGSMLKILNSSGQVVFSTEMIGQLLNIDISHFQSGIYLVTLQSGMQVLTKKLVVQHEKN